MKRIITLLLCLSTIGCLFTGCQSVSEASDYITKGEFFSMFIIENNLYSSKYSVEDIENSETYDIEAAIMLEWELIDDLQKNDLDKATTKDLLAQCCVRFMAFRQAGEAKIKDIKKCHDQQAIIDAVSMGIFELENGYFNAAEKMTYMDCLNAIDRTDEFDRNITFEEELEIEYQDNVQDFSGAEINSITFIEDEDNEISADEMLQSGEYAYASNLALSSNDYIQMTTMSSNQCRYIEVRLPSLEYDRDPWKYRKGTVLRYDPYDISIGRNFKNDYRSFAGEVVSVNKEGMDVILTIQQCGIEKLVKETKGINKEATTYSVPMPNAYEPETTDVSAVKEGMSFDKTDSGTGVRVSFKHTFVVEDKIYSKQTWRNPKANPSITITATVDNFKVTSKNLGKMILGKKADANIKVNFDTAIEVIIEAGGLRYSPANNGNGKFFSNLKNSRFTGAAAGGSKEIKIGKVNLPLGSSGFTISCGLYLYMQMDGSIHVSVRQEHAYICSLKNGKPTTNNSSEKPKLDKMEINANIEVGLSLKPSLEFFSISLVDAAVKAGFRIDAMAGVYSLDDEPLKENVYATKEELDENKTKYKYCLHASISFVVKGELFTEKSVIGAVMTGFGCESPSIEKLWELASRHIENGIVMSSCSRKNQGAVELNSDEEILLESYKEYLGSGNEVAVKITSVPIDDKKISKYGGVVVKTGNKKVAKASFDVNTKTVMIEAIGEGSTEITVKIKKEKKGKKYYTQKISITVADEYTVKASYLPEYDVDSIEVPVLYYC